MTPHFSDEWLTVYAGDCREVLPTLAAESVDCIVTSPPYWGLRDYGSEGQLGLEATPELYVANLVAVFGELRRVLKPSGTCWLNLGDSLTEKQLVGIPWRVAFALQADGWYLRSDIIWSKPNPMPESVTDRPTKAHEYLFLLTKNARYFFDADAVREVVSPASDFGKPRPLDAMPSSFGNHRARLGNGSVGDVGGRNLRSVWTIATRPYPGAHFAVVPAGAAGALHQGWQPGRRGSPRPIRRLRHGRTGRQPPLAPRHPDRPQPRLHLAADEAERADAVGTAGMTRLPSSKQAAVLWDREQR